jgi:hypothetical protein
VNRFTFQGLKEKVESITGLKLLQWNTLTSGLVYCQRPTEAVWPYLPRRLKLLHTCRVMRPLTLLFDGISRLADRSFKTHLSQYGWGFMFGRSYTATKFELPSYFNVCTGCGAGHAIWVLRNLEFRSSGLRFYRCPACNRSNLLFDPPKGFE